MDLEDDMYMYMEASAVYECTAMINTYGRGWIRPSLNTLRSMLPHTVKTSPPKCSNVPHDVTLLASNHDMMPQFASRDFRYNHGVERRPGHKQVSRPGKGRAQILRERTHQYELKKAESLSSGSEASDGVSMKVQNTPSSMLDRYSVVSMPICGSNPLKPKLDDAMSSFSGPTSSSRVEEPSTFRETKVVYSNVKTDYTTGSVLVQQDTISVSSDPQSYPSLSNPRVNELKARHNSKEIKTARKMEKKEYQKRLRTESTIADQFQGVECTDAGYKVKPYTENGITFNRKDFPNLGDKSDVALDVIKDNEKEIRGTCSNNKTMCDLESVESLQDYKETIQESKVTDTSDPSQNSCQMEAQFDDSEPTTTSDSKDPSIDIIRTKMADNTTESDTQEITSPNTSPRSYASVARPLANKENIVIIDGLLSCNNNELKDLLGSYGMVKEFGSWDVQNGVSSYYVRMSTSAECEWVVNCLHGSIIDPESSMPVNCYLYGV